MMWEFMGLPGQRQISPSLAYSLAQTLWAESHSPHEAVEGSRQLPPEEIVSID